MMNDQEITFINEETLGQVTGGAGNGDEMKQFVTKTCPYCDMVFIIKTNKDRKYYEAHVIKCAREHKKH